MMRNCGNCKYFLYEDASGKGWCDENEMRTVCVGSCPKWHGDKERTQWAIRGWVARDLSTRLWLFDSEPERDLDKSAWCGNGHRLPDEFMPYLTWPHLPVLAELKLEILR